MKRHRSQENMEAVRVIMVFMLVFLAIEAVEMKKPIKSDTSSELTLESFLANVDYKSFRTFQRSIEGQLGLEPGTINTKEFRDYYESQARVLLGSLQCQYPGYLDMTPQYSKSVQRNWSIDETLSNKGKETQIKTAALTSLLSSMLCAKCKEQNIDCGSMCYTPDTSFNFA